MPTVRMANGETEECTELRQSSDGFTVMITPDGRELFCYQDNGEWTQTSHPEGGFLEWE